MLNLPLPIGRYRPQQASKSTKKTASALTIVWFTGCFWGFANTTIRIQAQDHYVGKISIEPHVFRTFDGKEHPAELGRLWVPENRNSQSKRLIQLAFIRLKSKVKQPGSPIVWLAGGPGTPGIVMGRIPVYFSLFDKLRDVSDVILLDQRGSGMSTPNLQCAPAPVPTDVFESATKWLQSYTDLSRTCAEHWRSQGIDLTAYTTDANADDLNDLRRALGADKISLIGHSYGTVLAQSAVRRHGVHLDRLVLASVEGTDNLLSLPGVWDMLLNKLSYFVSQDNKVNKIVPDLVVLYRRVLDKLAQTPVTLSITNWQTKQPVSLRVGKMGLQWLVRQNMTDARTYVGLPALFYTIDQNDYALLTRQMEPLYNSFKGRSPMANVMDCSVGWSAERLAQVQRESPQALFSELNLQWTSGICQWLGISDQTATLRKRVWSTLPTLFISGTLDTNTPPFEAEEVRWGFPNSTHLVIENSGHEMLPSPEVQSLIVAFFKGQDVSNHPISFERPQFMTVDEAKAAVGNNR